MPTLFRPSGGVFYHWRGLRRRKLWRSFSTSLAAWLESWNIPPSELLLISPSGGYTLPHAWLKKFTKIQAFDLDPLAPWLFRMRHRGLNINFVCTDMFWQNDRLNLAALRKALHDHPKAAVLFCNVLGQLPLEGTLTEAAWTGYLDELRELMATRHWATYHDLYTIENLPRTEHAVTVERLAQAATIEAALAFSGSPGKLEVIDHLLHGSWSQGLESQLMAWSLSDRCLHVIEGLRH